MINASRRFELFFQPPHVFDKHQEVRSTLYLLRRDIYTCFGYNPNDGSKLSNEALFPATMSVMAGIDLLAKFLYLDDESGQKRSRQRFIDFVSKYIEHEHSEALYQLRNSLLHSFGLYSRDNKAGRVYNFILDRNRSTLVEKRDDVNHVIDIGILWKRFESSIERVKSDISNDCDLQNNFLRMFDLYGVIAIKG